MLKTLPKTAHQQTVCEANYLRLKKFLITSLKVNILSGQLILTKVHTILLSKLFTKQNIL